MTTKFKLGDSVRVVYKELEYYYKNSAKKRHLAQQGTVLRIDLVDHTSEGPAGTRYHTEVDGMSRIFKGDEVELASTQKGSARTRGESPHQWSFKTKGVDWAEIATGVNHDNPIFLIEATFEKMIDNMKVEGIGRYAIVHGWLLQKMSALMRDHYAFSGYDQCTKLARFGHCEVVMLPAGKEWSFLMNDLGLVRGLAWPNEATEMELTVTEAWKQDP